MTSIPEPDKHRRHKTPLAVINWQKSIPKNCHTCCWYSADGKCVDSDDQEPPEDFAAEHGACNKWHGWEEAPF